MVDRGRHVQSNSALWEFSFIENMTVTWLWSLRLHAACETTHKSHLRIKLQLQNFNTVVQDKGVKCLRKWFHFLFVELKKDLKGGKSCVKVKKGMQQRIQRERVDRWGITGLKAWEMCLNLKGAQHHTLLCKPSFLHVLHSFSHHLYIALGVYP